MPGKGGLDESLNAGGKKTTYSGMKQFQNDIGTSWMGITLDADSPWPVLLRFCPGSC